jgi:hypothetical protein
MNCIDSSLRSGQGAGVEGRIITRTGISTPIVGNSAGIIVSSRYCRQCYLCIRTGARTAPNGNVQILDAHGYRTNIRIAITRVDCSNRLGKECLNVVCIYTNCIQGCRVGQWRCSCIVLIKSGIHVQAYGRFVAYIPNRSGRTRTFCGNIYGVWRTYRSRVGNCQVWLDINMNGYTYTATFGIRVQIVLTYPIFLWSRDICRCCRCY